jgi:hypothetical protein
MRSLWFVEQRLNQLAADAFCGQLNGCYTDPTEACSILLSICDRISDTDESPFLTLFAAIEEFSHDDARDARTASTAA